MLLKTIHDKKNRFLFFKYEKIRLVLKVIIKNTSVDINIRQKAFLALLKLPKRSSIVRLRNRCVFTGRSRFILSSFSMSRLMLRKLSFEGFIPNLQKSSW
uniref:Ribosomal protein S14 n=1 Tax=Vischeria stellata TaxID=1104407 RepID=A0A481XEY6_9STRA|nr:ribosomal protein S14 [Vischeria stellata]QBK36842.1 ribosomal protein S14 [Vischeria stellata]